MRAFRNDGSRGLALVGAVLVVWCLGCTNRVLGGLVERRDAGVGGSAGDGGDGGSLGAAGEGGSAGSAAGGAGGGTSGDPCVVSCGTAPCPVRAGQPRVLATSPSNLQIAAIAVDADTLYWGTYPSVAAGEIRSMPLAGGPSTLLAQNVVVTELYLDGSTLYYVTSDRLGGSSLVAIPAAGGTARVIATAPGIRTIASDASSIYFGQGSSGAGAGPYQITRVDRAGSGVTPLVVLTGVLWGFAVDDANVYWAAYSSGGTLSRRALAGGNIVTLHGSSAPINSPVVDGDDVVFVEGINTPDVCQSSVWAVSKAGGAAPRLVSPGTSGIDVWRPVRDATHLYWGRSGRQGSLLRTVKGQTPEILAQDQRSVGPVILGPADVYWIAGADSAYEVRTLPK